MTHPTCFHLSASSITAFKACPTRYRLSYRECLHPAEDTESLRVGTNWHEIHEVYHNTLLSLAHDEIGSDQQKQDIALQAVVDHLNESYYDRPAGIHVEDWDLERQTLLTCFVAYLWYYQCDEIDYLHQEMQFALPLHAPKTGLPMPRDEVLRVGKIDHIIHWQGMIGAIERKSTTRAIDPGGDYWQRMQKDTQVSMYALAFRDLLLAGELPDTVMQHPKFAAASIGNTLYDVWRRPQTRPKKLSQAVSLRLIKEATETGCIEYEDETFKVLLDDFDESGYPHIVCIDDVGATVEFGTNGKPMLRETVEMYCARLMRDICENPDEFFQRREVARTQRDLDRFRVDLWNIYQAQRLFDRSGCWFENEHQCRATYPCPFIPICYGPGADQVCETGEVPEGFRRLNQSPELDPTPDLAG